jgi:hypothetical protein
MAKRIAILQSNYVPWKGYFDLINYADEFILYDTAQFTKNDWRNRNKIKTPRGTAWLTIPVHHSLGQLIEQTVVSEPNWARKHWAALIEAYAKAAYFKEYGPVFQQLYQEMAGEPYLSKINHRFIVEICRILGIKTRISWSRDYELVEGQTERLVGLCMETGATEYLSGPSARDYIDRSMFEAKNIKLIYIDYSGYPEYHQLFGSFDHAVSILDLIFNEGRDAPRYMKSFSGCAPDRP